MPSRTMLTGLAVTAVVALLAACETSLPSQEPVDGGLAVERLDPGLCDPGQRFTLESKNAYFPLQEGRRWVLEGVEEGALVHLEIEVLRRTESVAGVATHVITERESHDGELVEESHNFFVEAADGTVCYFGEDVDVYEGGKIVSHEGSWRADAPGNRPGIIMPAHPRIGLQFQMEGAPGIAEDEGTIVGSGPVTVPAGRFTETIRVRELNALDGSKDIKVYAASVGLIIDGTVELLSY